MFLSILSRGILRAPEGDPAGGGGEPDPKAFDDAQIAAIGQIVNAAVTSQLKRAVGPAVADSLKAVSWKDILTPVVSELVPKAPPPGDDDPDDGDPPNKKKAKGNPELEKRITELATELERSKAAHTEAERRRLDAEQARRVDAATIKLRSLLQDKVAPGAIDHAISHLTVVQKRLKVDDEGNASFRVRRAPHKGLPEEDADVSLDEAVNHLLEESEMKIYLPAPKGGNGPNPGPRGNGSSFPTYSTPAQTDEEKARRAMEKEQALSSRLNLGNR